MEKFEYKNVFIWGGARKTTEQLNHYGREGWELVDTYWCWFYFKKTMAA